MNEWSIFLVIGELIVFVAVFVKITNSYSTTITKLTVTLENLQKCIEDMKKSKEETHKRIFNHLDEHDEVLNEHDKRISKLEDQNK
ncbi:hypothetical protein LI142_08100 [Eubacterium limosum]|uniref:hypothetical protein n=1 Tax=Eubacterium TaxID=1730 RepID=UPI001D074595|nr:hypothetical protein [Eubacterium limosum]MCB6569460.1 hypothetical protein [Eubacterium limosum]